MATQAFSTDGESDGSSSGDPGASDADSNEYVFEGFKVMFVEKVMLTPVTTPAPPVLTQAQSRRRH